MKSLAMKVALHCTILTYLFCSLSTPLYANATTGWRDFSLTAQDGIYDGNFVVEGLSFFRTGDIKAKVEVRNIGREEARVAVTIALFDSKRLLLTAASFSPPLQQPNEARGVTVEFLGSAEVFTEIRYYQLSIIERGER